MYRSFTDRVLGGVCGGLGSLLGINAWWVRVFFILLSLLTLGAFALLYLGLWIILPQESLLVRRRSSSGLFLLFLILSALVLVGWIAWITTGAPLFWPALLLGVSGLFFLRQLRG
ncbi:MAG: PspC domain-containing protein [Anaerolineae bacterium]|nr:PspC domain-containing protein [Anaerolineae bacterium]